MQVETTIQRMFDEWPDLYATREDCYNHLFCTIGNGYAWYHGQLVHAGELFFGNSETLAVHDADYGRIVPRARQTDDNVRKAWKESAQSWERLRSLKLRHGGVDIGEYRGQTSWYPVSARYSNILNYPDDIRPDWKAALDECREMLVRDGVMHADGTPNAEYKPWGLDWSDEVRAELGSPDEQQEKKQGDRNGSQTKETE